MDMQNGVGNKVIVVAAASADTSKIWYKIFKGIKAFGFKTYLLNPKIEEALGQKTIKNLSEIKDNIDALVLVVVPDLTVALVEQAVKAKVKEIWFQPGTFNKSAAETARANGVETHNSCFMMDHSIW
jgi:predicted CoA-binding protein